MRKAFVVAVCALAVCAASSRCLGAEPPPRGAAGAPAGRGDELIELDFPADMEVTVLIEYVSRRLGINIVYDESVRKKRVTVLSPARVPRDSLLGLLRSVLKVSGLMLVDTEQADLKKVVVDKDLLSVTSTLESDVAELAAAEATTPITQVFQLHHAAPESVAKAVKPLLGEPGGNSFTVPGGDVIIVTDRAGSLRRIAGLIEIVDRPGPEATIRFVTVRHLEAEKLARHVTSLLAEKAKVADASGRSDRRRAKLIPDERTNQIAVISRRGAEAAALDLIAALDVPAYEPPSPIRFYKLVNTTAAEVLATIRSLDAGGGLSTIDLTETPPPVSAAAPAVEPVGPNEPPAAVGQQLPRPPAHPASEPADEAETEEAPPPETLRLRTADALVTVDTNTNTIIVVAPPKVQAIYAELISMLDKRRPQVMIETTLATIDTSDGFSLGVEILQGDAGSSPRHLVFSSFGLSTVDPDAGNLVLKPGIGFNGLVIDPGTFSIVVKALASDGHTEVISAPKLLVNDNATATLTSVSEAPFTSVNASDTVATTSFAGYASAGTTLTVTPHIGEGDHLQLKYSVTLNSFTGEGSGGVPPPRQTNNLTSEVTVPDGYAVLIGGLKRKDLTRTVSKVPLLGDVPILKYLLSDRVHTDVESTLFMFIRPTILRDDQFEHLKYLSDRELRLAGMEPNHPAGEPMIME